ncbi:NAD(P)H-binding protein [Lapillicoccus sp.]|uniref:NAD(P)-dependent oxidoreductase n=1 Tax=Lapillicoccus sp. TaxID=1909287 RepID=UPI0025FF21F5|nr:NAD(P)H-binding protein [Lapillicoccus sp.]
MNISVFGASGPVGRAVVGQALSTGHAVTAVTRRPDAFGPSAPLLRVVSADVHDPVEVAAAIRDAGAVISTVGVLPSRKPVTTYSAGTATIIAAMRDQDVRRIVCVSSKELDEDGVGDEPALYRFFFARLLATINRTIYDDMRRMEAILRESDRDWTIGRPAGLFAADRVTDYRCPAGHEPGVSTSTADLADALIRSAVDGMGIGQTLQVLTDDDKPPYLLLLARQSTLHRH